MKLGSHIEYQELLNNNMFLFCERWRKSHDGFLCNFGLSHCSVPEDSHFLHMVTVLRDVVLCGMIYRYLSTMLQRSTSQKTILIYCITQHYIPDSYNYSSQMIGFYALVYFPLCSMFTSCSDLYRWNG
jgi:hypothetical protein